jgi:hypothetical protein
MTATLYVEWVGVQHTFDGNEPMMENLFVVIGHEEYGEVSEEILRRAFGDHVVDLSGMVQFEPVVVRPISAVRKATRGNYRFWRDFNDGLWQRVRDDIPDEL